jgi:hypothetical protein
LQGQRVRAEEKGRNQIVAVIESAGAQSPPRALLPQHDDLLGMLTHGLTLWVCAVGWDRALLPQLF